MAAVISGMYAVLIVAKCIVNEHIRNIIAVKIKY